jgi:GntR family transcriptional regulator
MPTITINLESPVPVYRQIADAIRQQLVNGVVQPGDQLPTVRQLATELGVHFNTVAQAYRMLVDEGWLDLKRYRGATVLDRQLPAAPSKAQRKQSLQSLVELIAKLQSDGIPARQIAGQLHKLADELLEGK